MSKDTSTYEVLIDERIEKDLEKIPKHIVEKFLKQLDEFEKNPIRPRSGFDVKPMEGYPDNTYRLNENLSAHDFINLRCFSSANAAYNAKQRRILITH